MCKYCRIKFLDFTWNKYQNRKILSLRNINFCLLWAKNYFLHKQTGLFMSITIAVNHTFPVLNAIYISDADVRHFYLFLCVYSTSRVGKVVSKYCYCVHLYVNSSERIKLQIPSSRSNTVVRKAGSKSDKFQKYKPQI